MLGGTEGRGGAGHQKLLGESAVTGAMGVREPGEGRGAGDIGGLGMLGGGCGKVGVKRGQVGCVGRGLWGWRGRLGR